MIVKVDFDTEKGKIRKLHGVGQPPFIGADYSMMDYLSEAGIPFSRLHDVGGVFGGGRFVDIPNIFRNFDAEETDTQSYDFIFNDHLRKALTEAGVEPYCPLVSLLKIRHISSRIIHFCRKMLKDLHGYVNILSDIILRTLRVRRTGITIVSVIRRYGTSLRFKKK